MLGSGDAGKGVVLKRMLMRLLGGLLRSTTGSTVSFLNETCKTIISFFGGTIKRISTRHGRYRHV